MARHNTVHHQFTVKDHNLSDFASLFLKLDKPLGHGSTRIVYALRPWMYNGCTGSDEYVLKIAKNGAGIRANSMEYEIWDDHMYDEKRLKWLAPVIEISECGKYLVMARTTPLAPSELPSKLPTFLDTDLHAGNLGKHKGHVVCHDYGYVTYKLPMLMKNTGWNKKKVKAKKVQMKVQLKNNLHSSKEQYQDLLFIKKIKNK